ncbi:MAG TPA: DUF222 domain-containing protein, partial [Aeromicrobium sp.]|nr:DUF222 domain-containing protein [Aeromicrobium sp.]
MVVELFAETTLADRLARIEAELDAIEISAYARQPVDQARHNASALRRLESRLATHVGAAVRAADALMPGRNSAQMFARDFGNDSRSAHRELRQAEMLAEANLTESAAAAGQISHKHATVIGHALKELPADVTLEQRHFAEKALIRDAARYSPADLATRGRR